MCTTMLSANMNTVTVMLAVPSECQIRDFAYVAYRHSTLFHYSMKQFPTVVKKKQIRESGQTSDRCLQFVFVKNHGNNYIHTILTAGIPVSYSFAVVQQLVLLLFFRSCCVQGYKRRRYRDNHQPGRESSMHTLTDTWFHIL